MVLAAGASLPASAQEVVAVLSSESQPYRDAYAAFQEAFGAPVPRLPLGERARPPREARVVVAFGSKAALAAYPDRVALVVAMAPAARLSRRERAGPTIRVGMLPEASAILAGLKEVQPGLKRLAILWTPASASDHRDGVEEAAAAAGVALLAAQVDSPEDLPDALRGLLGKADALWLPPDPVLATRESFSTISEFCSANAVPFYAPTQGLVQSGAAASVSASFAEIGRTAAAAAKALLAGKTGWSELAPRRAELSLNLAAAARAGLRVPEAAVKKADKVFP